MMPFTPGLAIRILTHEGPRAGRHSSMDALIEIVDSADRVERVLPEITELVRDATLTATETRLYSAHES